MSHLIWGLQTTAIGMGLVFGLLALLWGLLTLVLRLDVQPAAPAAPAGAPEPLPDAAEAPGPDADTATGAEGDLDADLVAAILVATLAHRAHRRREAAPAMRSHWPGSLLYASRWVAVGRARQNHSWQRGGRP
jgi:Na+-transporting methylmalonyl-CoA/oxaloacetate decarboxylase gamma subunit